MKKYSIQDTCIILGSALVFFAVTVVFPSNGQEPLFAGIIASIFAIYLGFAISGSRSRSDNVSSLLKELNGYTLIIYRLSEVFGKKIHDQTRKLLDDYLIDTIDYELRDFNKSEKSFKTLYEYLINLPVKNDKQDDAYSNIIDIADDISVTRTKVETLVRTSLSTPEWIATIVFSLITVAVLYLMSDGTMLNSVIYSVAVGALSLLIIILHRSDMLKWDKDKWTWEPLHDLFFNMDLIPYYPADMLVRGEARLPENETIRIAYYPNWPEVTGKTVEVINSDDYKGKYRKQ